MAVCAILHTYGDLYGRVESVMEDDVEQRVVNPQSAAVVVDEAQLAKLVHDALPHRLGHVAMQLVRGITARGEVLEEVGADACRFFFLSRSADTQLDFDLDGRAVDEVSC